MRRFFLILATLSLALVPTQVFATNNISEDQAGLISMTCSSIKIQLKKLQKSDSKMRVQLGSGLESVLSGYIVNLNLRLVKNNLSTGTFTDLQTTFSSERDRFKFDFTDYSKSLEELISIDCQSDPYHFYDQLETTRAKRADLRASYLRLKEVLSWHRSAVVELKESL